MDIPELVNQPRESLAVELKSWISPDEPAGIKVLIKTAIAMRNQNGGYLLIGFDNDTGQPIHEGAPENVQELFHQDKIQGMVTKHASEAFEVTIHFPEIEGHIFPVMEISSGVRTPVGMKRPFVMNGTKFIPENKVFVRSLSSNHTASTTEATHKDWGPLVETCFKNREADIGGFLRRQIGGLNRELVQDFARTLAREMRPSEAVQLEVQDAIHDTIAVQEEIAVETGPTETVEGILNHILQAGSQRYQEVVAERQLELPDFGTWEVASAIEGEIPKYTANLDFLNLIDVSNPSYTGWPVWVNSRTFRDVENKPRVYDGAWEALIYSTAGGWEQLDFWKLDPIGKFYLLRALQDDFGAGPRGPQQPLIALDFGLSVIRPAEAIAVGLGFAKAMRCEPEQTNVAFKFRWTRLHNRHLVSWANPARYISPGRQAYQDELISDVTVPLDTPDDALAQYVERVVRPLFEIFDGFVLGSDVIEDLVQRLITRRL